MPSDHQVSLSETTSATPSNQLKADTAFANSIANTHTLETNKAGKGFGRFPAFYSAVLIAVLVIVGSYSLLPMWIFMCRLWLADPLRAIGSIFPLLAFAGTIAAWRRIGWTTNGSFWGLPLLAISILLARASTSLTMDFRIHQQNESVLHPGVAMFLYGAGAVLLFGGTRLLRAAIAPLLLLLLINPVPYLYNAMVDLPLQYLSANTARHFAHLIGLYPSGQQLRMMFTPDFGMQIVPGCNGVRGSVTLGYLALIFGYIRHLRPRVLALTAFGAFLMGYVLNLVRLCTLVIYYRIGISHPSIQPYGTGVDYGIGCTLFLFATLGVGLLIRWIEPQPDEAAEAVAAAKVSEASASGISYATVARGACFAILTLAFIVPALARGNSLGLGLPNEQALLGSLPQQVGPYKLARTYGEYSPNGTMQFALGDYSTPPDSTGARSEITFGVYVGSGMHLVATSRFTQGIRPDWIGSFDTVDGGAQKPMTVHYVTTLYDNGTSREYDAETACYETGCSANIETDPKKLFIVAPTLSDLTSTSNGKRLPILLRRVWQDTDKTPTDVLRTKFDDDARQFTQQLDLRTLLHQDGTSM